MMAKLEELTTGDALVRLLLEVDGLVVALHDVPFAENLAARRVCARELLPQMKRAVVTMHGGISAENLVARGIGAREGPTKMHTVIVRHHAVVARKRDAASGTFAWNHAQPRCLLVDNIARFAWFLLATVVGIKEMLRREGNVAGRAGNCDGLVVLRPGVGVEGAWVDAQLGGVFWTIADEALLVLLGRVVGLGKLVQGRVGRRAWVDVATGLVHGLGVVEQPGVARLSSLLLLLLVVVEADEIPSVGAHQRACDDCGAVVDQTLACTTDLAAHHLELQLVWVDKLHAAVTTACTWGDDPLLTAMTKYLLVHVGVHHAVVDGHQLPWRLPLGLLHHLVHLIILGAQPPSLPKMLHFPVLVVVVHLGQLLHPR